MQTQQTPAPSSKMNFQDERKQLDFPGNGYLTGRYIFQKDTEILEELRERFSFNVSALGIRNRILMGQSWLFLLLYGLMLMNLLRVFSMYNYIFWWKDRFLCNYSLTRISWRRRLLASTRKKHRHDTKSPLKDFWLEDKLSSLLYSLYFSCLIYFFIINKTIKRYTMQEVRQKFTTWRKEHTSFPSQKSQFYCWVVSVICLW